MRYYLGMAKEKGVTEGAIREAMAAAVATNGGGLAPRRGRL